MTPAMPDVLLIVTDDQRAQTIDWMDAVKRKIIARGGRYPNGMIPTSVCCPSRASLLTGLFAHSTGVWSNGRSDDIPHTGGWSVFHAAGLEERTIAVWLQQAGYRTVLVGKYLNGYDESPAGYVPPGWTRWHAFAVRNGAYFDYSLRHTDGSETTHGHDAGDYSTDVLARIAVRAIRDAPADQPLFLMFTPYAAHGPATPAPRHVGTATVGPLLGPSINEADVSDKPPWVADLPPASIDRITQQRRNTQETLRSADEAIAALIDAFEQHRDIQDTLIIFTSDNGHLWGEHRLRGKNMSYNVSSRVPLAMRWAGHVEPASEDRRLALNVDVTATIAEAAGASVPDDVEGVSLLGPVEREGFALESPLTNGQDGSGQKVARPGYCGFRTRRFVYVRYSGGMEELYDYREDPMELTNVAEVERYTDQLAWMRARTDEECSPRPPGYVW
jgi:N-acetylglucosamine-6-sulfatase